MSIVADMCREIPPFFLYATENNPSRLVRVENQKGIPEIQRVYDNCVACNEQRYYDGINPSIKHRLCSSCDAKLGTLIEKYQNADRVGIFIALWAGLLDDENRNLRFAARL